MSGKRRKTQLRLALGGEGRSEARQASGEGSETLTAKRMIESPASACYELTREQHCVPKIGPDEAESEELGGSKFEDENKVWPSFRRNLLIRQQNTVKRHKRRLGLGRRL